MTVAAEVREFVNHRPYVAEALEYNIVNMGRLARLIQRELNLPSAIAIKAALRRHSVRMRNSRSFREEAVLSLLRLSKLMVIDNLSIVMTHKEFEIVNKIKMKLSDLNYVYVVEKGSLKKIQELTKSSLRLIHEECAALVVTSPEQSETTPGVVWYLLSLLSTKNVYSLAFASCYTETTIVVERSDAIESYAILSKVIG